MKSRSLPFPSWSSFSEKIKFKVSIVLLMMLSIFGVFSFSLLHFSTTDPFPDFEIITEERQKEFGAFTVKVETGMFLKNFSEFNVAENKFIADAIIWFEFNSDEITLDTIGKFSFDNGTIIKKSPPDIRISDNKTRAKYDVRISFKSDLEYFKFPLEDHRVSLILTNNFVTPQEMFFDVDNSRFNYDSSIFIPNWSIRDVNTDTGFANPQLDVAQKDKSVSYPQASFVLNIQKNGIRKVLVIFLPLFLLVLLSVFSFLMSLSNTTGRFALASSALSGLLGYRFVIENMLPRVGYFTVTDTIYMFLLSIAFSIFVFQLLFTRAASLFLKKPARPDDELAAGKNRLETINMTVFLLVVITLLGSTVFSVLL